MKEYDTYTILDKGFENEESLNSDEWTIFIILYFESLADMEGWDHFFSYKMNWYPILIETLDLIKDTESLSVINNYKKHITDQNIEFTSEAIDTFLLNADDKYFDSCPDWREDFSDLSGKRWELLSQYFNKSGLKIKA